MSKLPSLSSTSPPMQFLFHGKPLRVFVLKQGPRFVAADIAVLLKYPDESALLQWLDGRGGRRVRQPDAPAVLTLSERETFAAIQGSSRALARRVGRWLLQEVLPTLPVAPSISPETLELAYALAGEAARQVGLAVWERLLAGEKEWQQSRWLVSLHYEPHNRQRRATGAVLGLRAEVSTLSAVAEWVAESGRLAASNVELIKLAAACHLRLAERMGKQAARCSS